MMTKRELLEKLIDDANITIWNSKAFIEVNTKYIDINPDTKMQIMSKIAEANGNISNAEAFIRQYKKFLKEKE